MKKDKKVIKSSNFPSRLPIYSAALCWLFLDYYNAPDWLWGCLITLWSLVAVGFIVSKWQEEDVDIFEEPDEILKKKSFREKLKDVMDSRN